MQEDIKANTQETEEEIEAMLDEDNGFDSDTAYYEDANERMIDDIIAQKDAEIMSLKIQVEHKEMELETMTRIVSQLLSKSTPKKEEVILKTFNGHQGTEINNTDAK